MSGGRRWWPAGITVLSAIIVVIVASRTDQGFYSDPASQAKAVQQFLRGESPRPVQWIHPDDADLSRDAREALIWWAPGTAFAVLPLMRAGLTPAQAARAIAAAALIAGAVGWIYWLQRFGLPGAATLAFALVLPWMRSASNNLFLYAPEILAFAAVPWVLLSALAADERRHTRSWPFWCVLTGALAGGLYLVKYSACFVTAGVLAWFAWRSWRDDGPLAGRAGRLVTVGICTAVPVVALSMFNRSVGGSANMVTAAFHVTWHWDSLLYAIANPALAAADLNALLAFVLMHPVHGVTQNPVWLAVIGLPGGLVLCALLARRRVTTAAADLARFVFVASVVSILVVWTVSSAVSVEARHLASAGLAALPLAVVEGCAWWRESGAAVRRGLALILAVFVIGPFGYGVVSVFAKAWRYPSDYLPGPSGYNVLLAEHDAVGVARRLQDTFVQQTDIWYLTEPMTSLDLTGRAVVRHADFMLLDELRRDRFVTSRPLRVHVLLPPRFEQNGKGLAIRESFPQALAWRRESVPGSAYDQWIAELR